MILFTFFWPQKTKTNWRHFLAFCIPVIGQSREASPQKLANRWFSLCLPKRDTLSLISTHAFCLPPAKFLAWDMLRVVKQTEQNKKISSALFAFEVQIFQLLRNSLKAKPVRLLSSQGHFTRIKNFHQMAAPQLYQAWEKIDLSIFSKQELSNFRLVFAGTVFRWYSKKVEINFSTEIAQKWNGNQALSICKAQGVPFYPTTYVLDESIVT